MLSVVFFQLRLTATLCAPCFSGHSRCVDWTPCTQFLARAFGQFSFRFVLFLSYCFGTPALFVRSFVRSFVLWHDEPTVPFSMDGGGGAQGPAAGGDQNSAAEEAAVALFPWETSQPASNGNGSTPGSLATTTTNVFETSSSSSSSSSSAAAAESASDPLASAAVISSSESSATGDPSPAAFAQNVLSGQSAVHLLNYALCGAVDETVEAAAAKSTGSNRELDAEALAAAKTLLQTTFQSTTRRVCCYMFKVGDLAFNCVQCQAHTTCVLCEQCFRNSDHEGHDVTFFRVSSVGGCCDCGDEAAWKPEGFCTHHGKTLALPDIFPSPGCVFSQLFCMARPGGLLPNTKSCFVFFAFFRGGLPILLAFLHNVCSPLLLILAGFPAGKRCCVPTKFTAACPQRVDGGMDSNC